MRELTEKHEGEKTERDARVLRKKRGAASPILEVMSKEMGVTTTAACKNIPGCYF